LKDDHEEIKYVVDNGDAHDGVDRKPLAFVDANPHQEDGNRYFYDRRRCYVKKLAEPPPLSIVRTQIGKI
jgi:hypothetical protein